MMSMEQSAKVTKVIQSAVACYKELHSERQKAACQLSLQHFFRKVESCQSTDPAIEPVHPDLASHPQASSE